MIGSLGQIEMPLNQTHENSYIDLLLSHSDWFITNRDAKYIESFVFDKKAWDKSEGGEYYLVEIDHAVKQAALGL